MAIEPIALPSTLLVSSRRGYLQTLASLVGAAAASAAASSAAATAVASSAATSPAVAKQAAASSHAASISAAPPPVAIAEPAPAAPAAPERILLQTSPVAGFQYHSGDESWGFMRAGDTLSLVREASNRFDERAVRLEWNGQKIGYVPARDNAAVSQLLDRDACLDAVITDLRESQDPWERMAFAVYLTLAS